jgi:hypothetical protein
MSLDERWKRIESRYHSALERPPENRQAFLDNACSQEPDLRREVESLLARADEAGSFLKTFHQARRSLMPAQEVARIGLSVTRDKIVFSMTETNGNIWLANFK